MVPASLLTPDILLDCALALRSRTPKFPVGSDSQVLYDYCLSHGVTKLARSDFYHSACAIWPLRAHRWMVVLRHDPWDITAPEVQNLLGRWFARGAPFCTKQILKWMQSHHTYHPEYDLMSSVAFPASCYRYSSGTDQIRWRLLIALTDHLPPVNPIT